MLENNHFGMIILKKKKSETQQIWTNLKTDNPEQDKFEKNKLEKDQSEKGIILERRI